MEKRRRNEDIFEAPSSSQLDALSEVVNARVVEGQYYNPHSSSEDNTFWNFVVDRPERFNYHQDFEHQNGLAIGYYNALETDDSKTLFLATQNLALNRESIVYDFYLLTLLKNDNQVTGVYMTSIDRDCYAEQGEDISILDDLMRGRCDAAEVERLIQILRNAEPIFGTGNVN